MKDLDSIYFAARELPPEDRPAYLTRVCGDDQALRARVEQMLAVADQADAFLTDLPEEIKPPETPAKTIKLDFPESHDAVIGQKIGRYKILECVGEGGCGVVYVAEQTEPVRRRVALKVIKLGMDTKQVVARFEAERQALAMMDHPNIAKVLDAGATETGRPYFVMELVRGIKITDYCDQANLPTKDRLSLFIQVCHAIQHAHQKGIIHRDIKPSNILVTLNDGVPVPKVIDFGIAKATEGRLTEATVYTQLHQFIGTPAYMSPEQAEMTSLDIDTRSDIYSLGVLLYELLAGATPFDAQELMSLGIDAMRKAIREKEPVRPSTRLATLQRDELTTAAKRRAVEAPKLIHLLKGDLDWIVMKCLEKDRTRRYETANGLAADLKRHLENEPILARPPSAAYKFQKAIRRNKLAFAAAAAVFVALCLGIIATTLQWARATRNAREALVAQAHEAAQRQKAEAALQEADKQRAAAQTAEKVAARQARQLGEDLYLDHLTRAVESISTSNLFLARKELNACDESLRNWEWRHVDLSNPLLIVVPGTDKALFTPDGRRLIICGDNLDSRKVKILDSSSGAVVDTFTAPYEVISPALSPDGQRLAFGDDKGNVQMWDLSTNRQIWSIKADSARPDGLVFSSDGTLLASANWDRSLKLLRADDGAVQREWQIPGLALRCPALSPDGRRITVAYNTTYEKGQTNDEALTVWDTATGHEVFRLKDFTGHVEAVTFSPDGRWIVSGGSDHSVRQWDATSGELVRTIATLDDKVNAVVFSPNERLLCTATGDTGDIQVREFEDGRLIQALPVIHNNGPVYWLTFNPAGTKLAAFEYTDFLGGRVNVFDIPTRETTHALSEGEKAWSVAFSPDGKHLASGGRDPVRIWDGATGELIRTIPETDGRFVTFSPDGLRVLTGGWKGAVDLFDVADGSLVRSFQGLQENVYDGAFSPDGRRVAAVGKDKVVCLWDTATGRLLNEFRGHATNTWSIYSVAFTPDGSRIATGADDNLRIWDADSGRLLQALPEPASVAVAFSPDGKTVADGGAGDQGVRLWEVATGQPIRTLSEAHQGPYGEWHIARMASGSHLVTKTVSS